MEIIGQESLKPIKNVFPMSKIAFVSHSKGFLLTPCASPEMRPQFSTQRKPWRHKKFDPIRGRRQIVFITLSGILAAKVLLPPLYPLAAFTQQESTTRHLKPVWINFANVTFNI